MTWIGPKRVSTISRRLSSFSRRASTARATWDPGVASNRTSEDAGVWINECVAELRQNPKVVIKKRTTVFGYYDYNYCVALERLADHLPLTERPKIRQRICHIRAKQVVIAVK